MPVGDVNYYIGRYGWLALGNGTGWVYNCWVVTAGIFNVSIISIISTPFFIIIYNNRLFYRLHPFCY